MEDFLYSVRKFLGQNTSRLSASLYLAAVLMVLTGCGSGSATAPGTTSESATTATGTTTGATGTTTGTTGTTSAGAVQLLVSSPQIPSSGSTTVDLTAIVLSADKQTVAGIPVTFSPGADTTAFISSNSGVSDDGGVVTAKLNLGTNKANRTITITATAGAAVASNSIDVTGTAITVSGNSSVAIDTATTLAFSLKDSAGSPMQGVALSLTSKTGNTIALTPATGATNSSGQISAVITATKAGDDLLTVSGGGATATKALSVSSASFAFSAPTLVAPATAIDIPLSPPTTISVTWNDATAGGPQVGKQITFASSRGTVSGSPATTNTTGLASVTVSSPLSSGPAIITASGPGGTPAATLDVVFVASTASTVTVQAIPSTIQVTTTSASQTSNSSTVTAVVRDAAGNLVKNAGVNFSIAADPSGGTLTAARGITDVSGSASVTYVAGNISSPQNGVKISATVSDVNGTAPIPSVANTTALTVTGQSLFVRLGTDDTVSSSPPFNIKNYIAIVTDSGGHPVSGAEVRFVLRPGRFAKGTYSAAPPASTTTTTDPVTGAVTSFITTGLAQQSVSVRCANEDTDFSGIIDPSKDLNQNGQLDPGGIANVSPSATTDANGIATASITYPKSHATWVEVTLEARTGVAGNDPPAIATFVLPGLLTDYEFGGPASLGSTSPYGASAVCNNTL